MKSLQHIWRNEGRQRRQGQLTRELIFDGDLEQHIIVFAAGGLFLSLAAHNAQTPRRTTGSWGEEAEPLIDVSTGYFFDCFAQRLEDSVGSTHLCNQA